MYDTNPWGNFRETTAAELAELTAENDRQLDGARAELAALEPTIQSAAAIQRFTDRDVNGRARIIPTGKPIPLPGFVPTGAPLNLRPRGIGC